MKIHSVPLARSLAFIDLDRLDPNGRLYLPDFIKAFTAEYSFLQAPKTAEFDEKKGLEFKIGKIGDMAIDAVKIFDTLLVVETHAHTDQSQHITQDMLVWAKDKFGVAYEPDMIQHWGFVGDIIFHTDAPILDEACAPLKRLGEKAGKALSDIWKEPVEYQPIVFSVGHDPLSRKNGIATFSIQRRAERHFSENIYFSEAPLPTDVHIRFLEEFEADVLKQVGR